MSGLRNFVRLFRTVTGGMSKRPELPDYLCRQVERSWRKESRNLQWFGLSDGMSVLDLGCGPGHFTQRLVEWLPGAKVTALDAEQNMLQHALRRLGTRATIVRARAEETGLRSGSFDFVLARLLFQHLRDPLPVAREVYRLLRPGGKFVITDVDDELFGVVEPAVPELRRVLERYAEAQAKRGGNRHVGRMLFRLLRTAGFADLEIESVASHSDEAGIEACFPQLDPMPLRSLVAGGLLSHREYSELRAAHERFEGAEGRFALVLLFMACGVRPAAVQTPV